MCVGTSVIDTKRLVVSIITVNHVESS